MKEKEFNKPNHRDNSEKGFILIWFSFTTLGLLIAGFTFLLYSQATLSKLKAQYIAMDLVLAGGMNAEFGSQEALNNMAMTAHALGFSNAQPTNGQVQVYANGAIYFEQELDPKSSTYGISSYVEAVQSPIQSMISSLGDLTTASYALSRPSPLYLDFAFDYSSSLSGGSINQILEGFNVIDSVGAASTNGILVGSEVEPTNEIQTVMPFSFDPYLGIALPWNEASTVLPTVASTAVVGCTDTLETDCQTTSSSVPTHKALLKEKAGDLFMWYKKTMTLLLGVAGRITPYTDVNIFGGDLSDDVTNSLTANLGSSFPTVTDNGVFPISEFDEDLYTNYSLDAGNLIIADVDKDFTYDAPKDLFRDPVSMSPNRILQIFLDQTFYRKLLKYGTLRDLSNTILMNPGDFEELLSPLLPVIEDPQIETDSFTFNPGPLVYGAYENQLANELYYKFGWPSRPSPLLSGYGQLFPADATIPNYIKYPWEYNCTTGPPIDNAEIISNNKGSVQYQLCKIYNQCHPGSTLICDSPTPPPEDVILIIGPPTDLTNIYRIRVLADQPNSPYCALGNARCYTTSALTAIAARVGPICVNGTVRCLPSINFFPQCVNAGLPVGLPSCVDFTLGPPGSTYDPASNPPIPISHSTATSGDGNTPGDGSPIFRGKISFPAAVVDPDDFGYGNIFHYLMDLVPLNGGTYTQNTIPNSRCQAFKDRFAGFDPNCALILVTDGRPYGVDANGNTVTSDADMMTDLTTNIDLFTGNGVGEHNGKIFTWYLDHSPSDFDDLVAELEALIAAGTILPGADVAYSSFIISEQPIDIGKCPAWDADRPASAPDCATYNATTLPEHLADQSMYGDFQTLMSTGSNRIWVETTLTNNLSGPALPATFFNGLEQLLVSLKQEVKFQK